VLIYLLLAPQHVQQDSSKQYLAFPYVKQGQQQEFQQQQQRANEHYSDAAVLVTDNITEMHSARNDDASYREKVTLVFFNSFVYVCF
jgi:hypothetical protein